MSMYAHTARFRLRITSNVLFQDCEMGQSRAIGVLEFKAFIVTTVDFFFL